MTLWSVGDAQTLGSLLWVNGSPILTLFLEVQQPEGNPLAEPEIPLLERTKPPTQATITGELQTYGVVTLERCARYNVRKTQNLTTGKAIFELDFLPTSVWLGAPKDAVDGKVTSAIAHDSRLAGFFGAPRVTKHRRFDPEAKALFEALSQPESIWAVYGLGNRRIKLGDTGWELSIYTNVRDGTSATEGHTLQSTIQLSIQSHETTTIEKAEEVLAHLEEIVSVFSIEAFSFQAKEFKSDDFTSVFLVWRLGDDHDLFVPPMRHQILIDFTDANSLETVCREWFGTTENVRLSQWLFTRALKETKDGLARFVAVAQAFEVLGREKGPDRSMPRNRLKEAIDLIREALTGKFESEFIERALELVRSSNKSSFRDVLTHIFTQTVEGLKLADVGDLSAFSKLVSDTRNAVVHMSEKDKGQLNEAFARVNKLSLQLSFWYAVCQAYYIGVKIPNIGAFLANNRNARHGLPNEILER
jgi:hypothetical protein